MANTPNQGITYPTISDTITPLADKFATLATSVDAAFTRSGVTSVASVADRTAKFGNTPAQGTSVWRLDRGWQEVYYAAYNGITNPGGASPAGWYPVGGAMPTLLGANKGSTGLANGSWVSLNTSQTGGTNYRNDGFTYGVGQIGVPMAGLYQLSISVQFDSAGTGDARLVRVWQDSSSNIIAQNWLRFQNNTWSSNQNQIINVSGVAQCVSSFGIDAYQNSGSTVLAMTQQVSATYLGPRRV